nr:MAG TPA: hypothetical protein [Caudoviricetes sp.]
MGHEAHAVHGLRLLTGAKCRLFVKPRCVEFEQRTVSPKQKRPPLGALCLRSASCLAANFMRRVEAWPPGEHVRPALPGSYLPAQAP